MKICIISVNKSDYAPRRFFEEGKKRGHQMYLTTWASLVFKLDEDGFYLGDGNKKIDEFDVDFRGAAGRYFTLIFCHKDKPGMLALITKAIADKGANIANLQNSRLSKGGKALTIVCLDSPIALADILAFEKNDDMYFVRSLTSIDS